MKNSILSLSMICAMSGVAQAETVSVPVHMVDAAGVEQSIGTITLKDSKKGLLITPALTGLPPGEHGFHVHENPDCGAAEKDGKLAGGIKAGGHFDPLKLGTHAGPDGKGHRGDLYALKVAPDGAATAAMTVERLQVKELLGRSLMIHAGGDNYSDSPAPLGGGGARIACGVIPATAEK